MSIEVPYELADVTLRLDLSNFDFATKTGATFTVTVTEKTPATEPETTVPATEPETTVPATEPETTVPATEPETTAPVEPETTVPETEPETTAPATGLNIKATSNYFPATNYTLTEADGTDLVTVTYYFDCAKQLLNTQWTLTFDPAVLSALPENNVAGFMPFATKGAMYETPAEGVIKGSASDLGLYDIKDGQAFVQVTFKALTFDGDTVVDLYVEDLTVAERNAEGKLDEEKQEALVENGVIAPTDTPLGLLTFITPGPATPVEPETTAPVEPETTTAPVEPETTAPVEPETTAPVEPETTAPVEPETTAPVEPETTAPVEPETTAPVEPETTAPATEAPTDAPSTDATGTTGATVNPGTADTPAGGTTSNGSAVQTGNASMAVIILLVLVSACGVLYFTRKRVK